MSGRYYVSADQGRGAHWAFTADDLIRTATEIRPDADVSAPFGPQGTIEIRLRGEQRSHSVLYHCAEPVLVFREQDEIVVPAAMVLHLLQRLAPEVGAVWFADFEGVPHPLQVNSSVDDFVDDLLAE
ncbi:hypothetical protein OG455_10485 [Kitasatospora sp. NBC_01287]|uniref:hypothetical protein n=1 Tax=Kitasatospora sp. NBC_01287 TaxID=2903573 RepID=UPI002253B5E9|nr:hypothetical protein [Kitasatospora sp. NBC_01287]MCX4745947.1 hypothetical protein [Kitasatospora sp. NBC_01287]